MMFQFLFQLKLGGVAQCVVYVCVVCACVVCACVCQLKLEVLLKDLHLFLSAHPPSRSSKGTPCSSGKSPSSSVVEQQRTDQEMPLRTVKTILNELVKLCGPSIREHLTLVGVHLAILSAHSLELRPLPALPFVHK